MDIIKANDLECGEMQTHQIRQQPENPSIQYHQE